MASLSLSKIVRLVKPQQKGFPLDKGFPQGCGYNGTQHIEQLVRMAGAGDEQAQAALDAMVGLVIEGAK